jgi:hypothetical protein
MTKYKVYGDKLTEYYTVVTADSEANAYEFAANNDHIDWFEIETDNTIVPYNVELQDELDNSDI